MTKQEFTDLKRKLLKIKGEVGVTEVVEKEDKFIVTLIFPYTDYTSEITVERSIPIEEAIIKISKFADKEIESMIGHLRDQISKISKELLR